MSGILAGDSSDKVNTLEFRVRHLDDRVGAMGADIAGINATMHTVVTSLEDISRRVNEPQKTQWQSIIAAISLALTLAITFTHLSTSPISAQMAQLSARQETMMFDVGRHRESSNLALGSAEARITAHGDRFDKVEGALLRIADRLYDINRRLGEREGRQ